MLRASLVALVLLILAFSAPLEGMLPNLLTYARAQPNSDVAAIAPSRYWGTFFDSGPGDVQVNINRTGIAVRVEIPREFLQGVITSENDTHFIQSDIRNDYYYYSVVDESNHWSYGWHGMPSDGPCFKPVFSLRDPNAPWCIEIWNYLNAPQYRQPVQNFDYCARKFDNGTSVEANFVFTCFSPPKFIRFRNLNSPSVAGVYNFTVFVANRTNSIGYPDFVHAWNKTLFVPVSMSDDPASISGWVCDADVLPPLHCPVILHDKGIAYARNVNTGQIARAYVNQTGNFTLIGLAPGSYVVQASAGPVNGVAYSLSEPQSSPIRVDNGDQTSIGAIQLHRAPQVCGQILYEKTLGTPLAHSFSDHPYLKTVLGSAPPLKLNITVEATDAQGHVYRYSSTSLDDASDSFLITTGSNITYVGTDPYGTEFAGLPPIISGSYQLTVKVWIEGYVQAVSEQVTVSTAPGFSPPYLCNGVSPNPVVVLVGGVVSGTIQLWNLVALETPNQAMIALGFSTSTAGLLFGGDILIQAYDHSGLLRGVVVNGTTPALTGDVNSIRFYIIGFSEYANHTLSGVWNEKDQGLPADQAYTLRVYIRGYEQAVTSTITLAQGGNSTVTIRMVRGGLFRVGVGSYNNRFGTRVPQSPQRWMFLNLTIPVRARVYFYDSGGRTVGFVERLMETGVPNGVRANSFDILFTGQNWSIREIWFYGYVPTDITNDTYSIKAFTLGYVQLRSVNVPNQLTGSSIAFVTLLIANEIDLTGPIFASPALFSKTTENVFATGEAFDGAGLAGALPANISAYVPSLPLPIFGFGATINVSCAPSRGCASSFWGQGHFFYVSQDGTLYFDYGLDTGTYTAQIPEFGFNYHLTQIVPPVQAIFTDLSQEQGFVLALVTMGRIVVGGSPDSLIRGWVRSGFPESIGLSWVQVEASNSTFSRSVTTLDGEYKGVGALFLPQGVYNITFSVPFYKSQTRSDLFVTWASTYSVVPPDGPLCPTGGISGICDPPPSPSPALLEPHPVGPMTEVVTPQRRLTSP